jgi:hypothetical protein
VPFERQAFVDIFANQYALCLRLGVTKFEDSSWYDDDPCKLRPTLMIAFGTAPSVFEWAFTLS